jgi:HAD superfamily hydrolase (TIGR01509 family)
MTSLWSNERMRALLVDLYDTIVRADWSELATLLSARLGLEPGALRRAFDVTRPDRGAGRFGGVTGNLAALAGACGVNAEAPLLAELADEAVAFLRRNTHLYDDVLPALRRLRAGGTAVALVSNCDHATRPLLETLELEREMDALVLSFEVGSVKPEARIFREALDQLGATPDEATFVDDQPDYLDGAARLGLRTFRMVRGATDPFLHAPGAHPVITSLDALTSS